MSVTALVGRASRLTVHQKSELLELMTSFEGRNRYALKDEHGTQIGYAAEESGGVGTMLLRSFMGRARAVTIHLYDAGRQEIGRVVKPFAFLFPTAEVFSGDVRIGTVEKLWTFFLPRMRILDAQGAVRFTLQRRFFRRQFPVLDASGQEVGLIAKTWGGGLREVFTDADRFGVEFTSPTLSEADRALLLGAVFFVDLVMFEGR